MNKRVLFARYFVCYNEIRQRCCQINESVVLSMKAIVDKDTCIGCGLCAEICPQVFEMGDDMIAKVIVEEVPPSAAESARDAAASCPVESITLSA